MGNKAVSVVGAVLLIFIGSIIVTLLIEEIPFKDDPVTHFFLTILVVAGVFGVPTLIYRILKS